ncbi:MAG: hypothetical protein PHU21_03510 [Elusimicrobia bacterium]|nr:hypothetical protein [Elusimicrobiota bacterium]
MRLFFDAEPPVVLWCEESAAGRRCGRFRPEAADSVLARLLRRGGPESLSYRLRHGGQGLREPVSRATPEALAAAEAAVRYAPESNGLIMGLLRRLLRRLPDAEHLILCDTALFWGLPPAASLYAVPAELGRRGVRRYGGDGLLHQWAALRAAEIFGPGARRVVSVRLADRTNAAALDSGRPVDTTVGFTPVEGLLSDTCCGDIDSSVVFELQSSGLALSEINELLSARSGFRALVGRPCGFTELLRATGAGASLARRMLRYELVKTVGAFAALLGGVDALMFSTADPAAAGPFIRAVCRGLACLGRARAQAQDDDIWRVMSDLSRNVAKEV